MTRTQPAMCRCCGAFCPVEITVQAGRATNAVGDEAAPLYEGFICPKGRALPAAHNNRNRLLHSLKRQPDGSYSRIATDQAIEEIAAKLSEIIAKHGPNSVAAYIGGPSIEQQAGTALMQPFLKAIGSSSLFSAATLDQPGMIVARALHGEWQGGRIAPQKWEVFLMVGGNPIISKQYFAQNPGQQMKAMLKSGAKLIVIDPRRTETARKAHVHLQCIPGEDPTIIAGLIKLIMSQGSIDTDFIAQNAEGLDALHDAVRAFTPDYVAARAGISELDLREAARVIGLANAGDFGLGTGPAMATRGSLTTYLVSCLQTLRGFWARAGARAINPSVLQPPRAFKAQARAPIAATGFGRKLRIRGLEESVAGLPTSALPEEILTPGPGQIRALFMGAGAMMTWPQQDLAKQALESLDLLVTPDVELSPTARVSTYVLATKMQLEVPACTLKGEQLRTHVHPGYGWDEPYAAYSPAVLQAPEGSDLIETLHIYYRIIKQMGLQLELPGRAPHIPSLLLDMSREPSSDEILELICRGSRIPLAEVKKYPHGHIFEEASEIVQTKELDCTARLQLADPAMLRELATVRSESIVDRRKTNAQFPLLLIPRRMQNVTNSSYRSVPGLLKRAHNPAFLNPADLCALGLDIGELVEIRSRHGMIIGVVESDPDVRAGVLSMTHGFGVNPGEISVARRHGGNTNRLLRMDDDFDPYTGMPRMGAVPVSVTRASIAAESTLAK